MRNLFKGKMIIVVTAVLLALFFTSCSNNPQENLDGTSQMVLSVSADKTTTLTPTSPAIEDITWSYTLTKADGSNGIGQVTAETKMGGTSVSKSVSYGSWKAEVWGYRDTLCRELVYHGTGTGTASRSGGTIAVNAVTMTDAGMAHAFSASDTPKATADIVLKPVGVEGDASGSLMKTCVWYLDGTVIATWTATDGVWRDSASDAEIPSEGVKIYATPGTGHTLVLQVKDETGATLGAEGWDNASLALNCTYIVQGNIMPRSGEITIDITVSVLSGVPIDATSKIQTFNSFFDINPTQDMPSDSAIVIGYSEISKGLDKAINSTSLTNAISYPYDVVFTGTTPAVSRPYNLGLEPIYVTTVADLKTSRAKQAWFGKTAVATGAYQTYNSYLEEIRFADNVSTISQYAFYGCTKLKNITIPATVTTLDKYAFCDCTSLTDATLGTGVVKTPGAFVFKGCTALRNVTVPEGVKEIGQYMFDGCSSLTSITIPSTVTTVGTSAFRDTGLTTIKINQTSGSLDLSGAGLPSGCTVLWRGEF